MAIMWLGGIMLISFVGLIIVQSSYIREAHLMHESQFNDLVRRCLFRSARVLEEEETNRYLLESISKDQDAVDKSELRHSKIEQAIKMQTSCKRIPPKSYLESLTDKTALEATSQIMQKRLKVRFREEKALLDDLLMRLLCDNYTMPITERVDFGHLNAVLERQKDLLDISIPHRFAVVDRSGVEVYKSDGYEPNENTVVYSQMLFPNDPTQGGNYMKIYFPTRKTYVFSMMKSITPALVLSGLLLFTFIVSLVMITREKKLSQMRSDFMNNMTHELKTPVSSISLASQMLSDDSVNKTPKMISHLTGVIADETKRLTQQIDKVLQMSILERESSALKLVELDINDLVVNIASNFAIKVEARGGDIETDIDADNPFVKVDDVHFTNIIYNLLDNALKYTEGTPMLKVRTWNEKDKLFISVTDNGIGIRKSDQKKVFEKFFRVSTGSVHNVKGFGLGLAYVHKVVTDHKGKITCDSVFGKGTTFTISIPSAAI